MEAGFGWHHDALVIYGDGARALAVAMLAGAAFLHLTFWWGARGHAGVHRPFAITALLVFLTAMFNVFLMGMDGGFGFR
ncbi:hypothetical protein [Roseibacillus ishigakijimensis]|uniref:Uncharacterized protein n=1 Tax=Roseibacillus ishigakijimensis TaxID=454146 RepID=A0A934RQP3_9BACT|nr:hypothetical protein [Roseibacillus ishigakijimensis]MBK1833683.1 hypothetical protein [Roseibacillus ishigakijimensis]